MMVDVAELGKGVGTGAFGGLGADLAEGNGLDIASKAAGDAIATAMDVLGGLGLELPFSIVFRATGVMA